MATGFQSNEQDSHPCSLLKAKISWVKQVESDVAPVDLEYKPAGTLLFLE